MPTIERKRSLTPTPFDGMSKEYKASTSLFVGFGRGDKQPLKGLLSRISQRKEKSGVVLPETTTILIRSSIIEKEAKRCKSPYNGLGLREDSCI